MRKKFNQMTDMEKSVRLKNHYIVHIAFYAFMFNLLPVAFMGSHIEGFLVYMLILGFPAVIYIASIIFGLFNGFKWLYILFPAVLFVPAAFIYYDYSALLYAALYAAVSALGMFAGFILVKLFTKKPATSAGSEKVQDRKKK
ncbi:MAG TPA: hypothetical protein P5064_04485 [Clostridia bacterium]|jgi:nitrate reductase NapE component|nr:hypothetical protein [Clostridiaceae bacterium]HOF26631.1 hypothetical protein [Clostridia bacterium]HOM34324.1 hypothetical protein [Clostridia bacterium]HOR89370.1 hypothetical protein [Clostridia bacterium]HOT71013.1 hypothetical protein [Clostridia bacterium]